MPSEELSEDDAERVRDIKGNGIDVIRSSQHYISDPRLFAPLLEEDVSGLSDDSNVAGPT